jgi:type VI secretion system secreted protein Hcp
MPGNAFIKFAKAGGVAIVGESLQTSHPSIKGWCEISDWGLDVEAETNFLKGTGAAVGVATPSVVNFTHTFDKSSPVIMNNIIMGTAFDTVVIHMLKATGAANGQPEVYFGAKFANAFITKVSSKGGEDGAITQDVEFVFKTVTLSYKKQLNTGGLAEKAVDFGWDVAQRTTTGVAPMTLDGAKD